jgi:hypothetical protein
MRTKLNLIICVSTEIGKDTTEVTCSKDMMADGADHVIAVEACTMCALEKPSVDTDLLVLCWHINMLLRCRLENIGVGVLELLQIVPFHGREDEVEEHFFPQLTLLSRSGGSILFPRSLTATDRKIVHRLAERLGFKSQSQGDGSNRRLEVWLAD